jgi:hypothetical protein
VIRISLFELSLLAPNGYFSLVPGKIKTPLSDYIQRGCVIPQRKAKEEAWKSGNIAKAVGHKFVEDYCIDDRERAKGRKARRK